ncbi:MULTISPECIES: IclR family transcriptional regulator [Actinosynnema]|uniref:IclR family transcriptional regulator n=1 Tax=Actinosynnema TaxID=40566 RepID=UPI0020A298D2|nr:helix-turn-helix domain-containing protein [Actinosynnema pretiosum]MCP2095039.1 transcriptional regulator, IclR family [Actinosynnema pretiosum]
MSASSTAVEGDGGGIRAVSRAWRVLRAFTPERVSLSVAELVRETGLPRTTVLRLVETLAGEGLLEQGAADGQVRVGTALIAFAAFADAAWALPEATAARMRALAAETGETVSLYVRSGVRRVVVGQAPSPNTLRHVVQPGDELPLSVGSAAYVLLSLESAAVLEGLLPQVSDDVEGMRAAIAEAAERGWCLTHGQREPGNTGLAVPVPEVGGRGRGRPVVLALGGPTVRFGDEKVPGFVAAVQRCAADIAVSGLPPALG